MCCVLKTFLQEVFRSLHCFVQEWHFYCGSQQHRDCDTSAEQQYDRAVRITEPHLLFLLGFLPSVRYSTLLCATRPWKFGLLSVLRAMQSFMYCKGRRDVLLQGSDYGGQGQSIKRRERESKKNKENKGCVLHLQGG